MLTHGGLTRCNGVRCSFRNFISAVVDSTWDISTAKVTENAILFTILIRNKVVKGSKKSGTSSDFKRGSIADCSILILANQLQGYEEVGSIGIVATLEDKVLT